MSPKTTVGRPASAEPKEFISGFFLTLPMVEKLQRICTKRGITKTEFFKKSIQHAKD